MAGGIFGTAFLRLKPDLDGFANDADREVRTQGGIMGGRLGTAIKGGLVAFGAKKLFEGVLDVANIAGDLEEARNLTGLIFGDARAEIDAFVASSATALGIPEAAARESTAQIGGLLQNLGFAEGATLDWSKTLTGLSSDLGSAFNAEPAEAQQALLAALRGSFEPAQRFNVILDQATVNAKAVELGLAATTGEVDRNARAQATLALVMEQTGSIQGDFANTSDGLANRQRILSAQFTDLKARIGSAFLPVVETVVNFLSTKLLPAFEQIGPLFDRVRGWFQTASGGAEGFGSTVQDVLDIVRAVLGAFRAFWDRWGSGILDRLRQVADVIGRIFGNIVTAIRGIIQTIAGVVTGDWSRAWEGLRTVAGAWVDNLLLLVRDIPRMILSALGDLAGFLLGAGRDLIAGLLSGAANWVDVVLLPSIKALPGRILAALGSVGSLLLEAGKDLIRGMIGGVAALAQALWDKVTSVVMAPVNWVKDRLGISSPSTLFRDWGGSLMEGLAIGVEDGLSLVESAASSVVDVVTPDGGQGLRRAVTSSGAAPRVVEVVLDRRTIGRAAITGGTEVVRLETGVLA